jgi:cytochrome c-type biogenesis protein CcmE
MTRKRRRLITLLSALAALGAATALMLSAFNDNLVFFYSPSELAARTVAPTSRIRIGGLVKTDSLVKQAGGHAVAFRVTDGKTELRVVYDGILPDLFHEGQGLVAEGRLGRDGVFVASSVLAKHDEKYMPPEVADALKKAGHWQEGSALSEEPTADPLDRRLCGSGSQPPFLSNGC